jgi:glycosyltransferase involved in cell wall biosynthesis
VTEPTVGFLLEQTLGHITHAQNLRAIIADDDRLRPRWRSIPWDTDGLPASLPGIRSNWTLRAGLHARRAITQLDAAGQLDALFIHTQVPAVLAGSWLRRIPTIVSVDATPLQYDELGESYEHRRGSRVAEHAKWRANHACFHRAVHLVTWSHWAKAGLVDGYGVPPDKVTVIPPGVDLSEWAQPRGDRTASGPFRILFVGGDLDRKGGTLLLEAFRRLRDHRGDVELHLVTRAEVAPEEGVVVHHGMTPNSPQLKALYHQADVFCLPTRGDCLPMVLSEAGAAGLPLVSTSVGAIGEIVRNGETGFLVSPDDPGELASVLHRLHDQPEVRGRLGARATEVIREDHDAVANARRLVDLLVDAASRRVLLTVSGDVPDDVDEQVERGERPRPDYRVMADAFGAHMIDRSDARRQTGLLGGAVERVAGPDPRLALACFRLRHRYRVIVTDGEQVGLPYALLRRMAGRGRPRHLMITHVMSVAKKALLFRALRLVDEVDTLIVYATAQQRYLQERLGVPASKIVRTSFMVDTAFWTPTPPPDDSRTICVAGLEHRDYPTLIDAVRGLDVQLVIAAASPWSKRRDTTRHEALPDNVEVTRLGFVELRKLYADSLFVVMPLADVPFQAGVTTILEAMAMGRTVVCSRTTGQTDVIVDGETGMYVPPGDPAALRRAIIALLDDPERARRMGEAARRHVEQADVERYADRLANLVHGAAADTAVRRTGGSPA